MKSSSGGWCRARDLHACSSLGAMMPALLFLHVGDGVNAGLIFPEMVVRKHVHLSVFSKMMKISCGC